MENKVNIYTDLALEIAETLCKNDAEQKIDGVKLTVADDFDGQVKVTWVEIYNENGAEQMGRAVGNYVTVESELIKENDIDAHEEIIKILSEKLIKLTNIDENSSILIIGLGNRFVTPDSLGPKVISKVLVTRHIVSELPKQIDRSVRPVSAISPGVMGITGIETAEIVKGLVERVKPDLVIAIDALAARRTNRINATIQISDTGVSPGAGMGNKRMELNEQTLGVPVIAIGVPTVVDAATLVNDTMDLMLSDMIEQLPEGFDFYNMLIELEEQEKYCLVKKILDPYVGNMFVTPKEVDEVMNRLSNIIANALNIALHPGIDKEDINRYMY